MYITIERVEYYSAETDTTYSELDTYFRREVVPKITSQIYDADLNEIRFGSETDILSSNSDAEKSDSLFYSVYNNAFIVNNEEDQPAMKELCEHFGVKMPVKAGIFYYDEESCRWYKAEDVINLARKIEKIKGLDKN